MDLLLNEKRVLITASVNGIGYATAEAFLAEGAKVLLNGRNLDKLSEVALRLSEKYGRENVLTVCGDATENDTIDRIVEEVERSWKGLDILIPCVGTGKKITSDSLDIIEWEYMMNKNLYSAVRIIQAMAPLMKKSKDPNIVLVSSVVAISKSACPIAYAASKNGILSLNSYLSEIYGKTGIRVNAIIPGNIYFKGGRWEEIVSEDKEGTTKYIQENVPMKRFGRPEEIGNAIVFLASERSSFTNGAKLTIDGGQNRSVL